jgi:hypothetical protein
MEEFRGLAHDVLRLSRALIRSRLIVIAFYEIDFESRRQRRVALALLAVIQLLRTQPIRDHVRDDARDKCDRDVGAVLADKAPQMLLQLLTSFALHCCVPAI